eukprot:725748-Pleurochrysis_carterae.AAC.1
MITNSFGFFQETVSSRDTTGRCIKSAYDNDTPAKCVADGSAWMVWQDPTVELATDRCNVNPGKYRRKDGPCGPNEV